MTENEAENNKKALNKMEASNQQLLASNQQLKAAEQQLRASNQQLAATEQQLRASNQQLLASNLQIQAAAGKLLELKQAVEQAVDGIAVTDLEGKVTFANRSWGKMHGLDPAAIVGSSMALFHTPEQMKTEVAPHLAQLQKNGAHSSEVWHKRADGAVFPTWMSTGLLKDAAQKPIGFIGVARDITEQKAASAAALREQALLRDILDTTCDGYWLVSREGRIEEVNDAYCRLSGYARKEIVGKFIPDFDINQKPEEVRENIERIVGARKGIFETRHRRKDGSVLELEVSVTWSDSSGGKFVAFFRDLSERKKAEETMKAANQQLQASEQQLKASNQQLQASEQQLKASNQQMAATNQQLHETTAYLDNLLNCANVPIIVWDPELRIARFNKASELLTGRKSGEVTGKSLKLLFPPERAESSMKIIRGAVNDKQLESAELDIIHKNETDSVRSVLWSSATLFAEDGKTPVAIIAQGQDITGRKKAESAVAESYERLTTMLDSIDSLVYVADLKSYEILFMNKYGRDIFGDVQGKTCWKLLQKGNTGPCSFCTNDKLVAGNGKPTGTHQWEFQNTITGQWLECRDTAISWPGKGLVRMEIATDITKRKQAEATLRQNEALLRSIIDSSTDFIFVKDRELRSLICNTAYAKAVGKSPEEMAGKTDIENGWSPDLVKGDPARGIRGFETDDLEALSGKTVHNPCDPANAGGKILYFDTIKLPLRNADGKILGVMGIARDITERKEAEEALKESKSLTDSVVENVPLMIFLKEAKEQRFVIFNRAGEELLGYSRKDLLGKNNLDLFPPEQAANFMAKDLEVLNGAAGFLDIPEEPIDTAKKGRRLLHTRKVAIKGADGTARYLLGISEDITERKQTEQALSTSEERHRILFESSRDALMTLAPPSWRYTSANPATLAMFQVKDEATFTTLGPWDFSPELQPDGRPSAEIAPEMIKKAMEEGSNFFEWTHKRINGETFTALVLLTRVEIGGQTMLQATVRDITEQKRAEEELEKHRSHLEELVKERTEQLETANKELESFSYSVSHDLRAPLRAMDGFSLALLDEYSDKLDDQGRDYLGRVRAATRRMAELIEDLLKLARVSRAPLNRQTVDLSALVRTVAERLTKAQPERRVEFVIAPDLRAEADPALLEAAVTNLVENAWKFTSMKSPARIEFGALESGGRRAYFVRDDGAGFDMAYADKLFGTFQRLHAAKDFPGTGIGLATVRSIMQRHGGKIWAEGAVNAGAIFYFTL